MKLQKQEIDLILLETVPRVFNMHWADLKTRMTQFIDSLHDAQYGRKLKEMDPIFKSWVPKSDRFRVAASGREIKFYSLAMGPSTFERCWPDANRREVWWVAQGLEASEPKFYNASKGETLSILTPGHYSSAKGLQLAVIALLDDEVAFRVALREFLGRDQISRQSLDKRISDWVMDYGRR